MAIVRSDLKLDLDNLESIPWEVRKAQVLALERMPKKEIDYSDIPPMSEEELARMRPFREIMAERRERKEQMKQTTTAVS